MNPKNPTNIPVVTGIIALSLSLSTAVFGIVRFTPDTMLPNLVAEFSGVLLEVSIIFLVLDWITKSTREAEWKFAYEEISQRMSVVFVDLMRIYFVRNAAIANAVDSHRYDEFMYTVDLHQSDLRSHLGEFATVFGPETHQRSRAIERELTRIITRMKYNQAQYSSIEDCEVLYNLSKKIDDFFVLSKQKSYLENKSLVEEAIRACGLTNITSNSSMNDLHRYRMTVQTEIVKRLPIEYEASMGTVLDAPVHLPYFILDHQILSKIHQGKKLSV